MEWTEAEDAQLLAAFERGDLHREIAKQMGRSRQAIGYRLNLLGKMRWPSRRGDDNARFDSLIDKRGPDECWPWIGHTFPDGYGLFGVWPRSLRATRYAWERANGRELGRDEVVRHTCDTPLCVNPKHLLAGSHQDNENDKIVRGRHARGERHGMARYSAEQIERVKELLAEDVPRREVAKQTGVKKATVDNVASGRQWKEVVRR